jgi:hypothetical protein
MALTYTWNLTGLTKSTPSTLGVENVIIGTRWQVTGTDEDGNTGTFSGATPLNLETVDLDNFTPYEELTESQVLGWIQEIVSGSAVTNYWGHISERIEEQISQTRDRIVAVDNDFPWAPAPTPTPTPEVTPEETPVSGSGE